MKTILPLKLFFACWIALLCILLVRANDNSSSPFTADAALGGYRSNSQQTYGSQSRDFPSPLKPRPWHSRSAETLSSLQTLNPAASNALARAIPGDSICGKEDFELSELTASYKDGSFTGNQGIVWTYVHARNAGDYPIEGKGVMLRRADEPSSLSAKLPNGLGNFSVETRKAFTGKTQRKLELVVNDSVVAKFLPVDEPDKIQVFRVDSINVPNEVRVQLRLFGAKGNQQITLDNLKWTCYSKGASGPSTTWVDGRWTNGLPDGDKDVSMGLLIMGLIMLASWFVGNQLKRKFEKYSKLHLQNGMSGAEIAQKMLSDHGIRDVRVISTPGRLTDHYNPADKTVNLSEAVYNERNAAAAAVAAHEVGHAVQHATAYQWLTMRSKLVPVVNVASSLVQWVLLAGIFLLNSFPQLLLAGVILFAVTTLFSVITLPVEYDASNRALKWLENKHMLTQQEHAGAKDALTWAARTYLVAALASIGTLLYYLMIYMGRRE